MKQNTMNTDTNLNKPNEAPDTHQNDLNLRIRTTSTAFEEPPTVSFSSPAAKSTETGIPKTVESSQEIGGTAATDKPSSTNSGKLKTMLDEAGGSSSTGSSAVDPLSPTSSTSKDTNENTQSHQEKEGPDVVSPKGITSSKCPLPSYYGSLSDDEDNEVSNPERSHRRKAFDDKRRRYNRNTSLQANYDTILAQVEGAMHDQNNNVREDMSTRRRSRHHVEQHYLPFGVDLLAEMEDDEELSDDED